MSSGHPFTRIRATVPDMRPHSHRLNALHSSEHGIARLTNGLASSRSWGAKLVSSIGPWFPKNASQPVPIPVTAASAMESRQHTSSVATQLPIIKEHVVLFKLFLSSTGVGHAVTVVPWKLFFHFMVGGQSSPETNNPF